jgi:predicted transcriptional regulator
MRILVDVAESQVRALDDLARAEEKSRAAVIREAICDFLKQRQQSRAADGFGLWGRGGEDGLAYQDRIRREW